MYKSVDKQLKIVYNKDTVKKERLGGQYDNI